MGLKIILIPYEEYKPIQNEGTWEHDAMYVCKTGEDTCEIYIRGQSCGRQNMATQTTPGVVTIGSNLVVDNGRVAVETATEVHEGNTKPITSAGVHKALRSFVTEEHLRHIIEGIDQDKTYIHEQNIASATWMIDHNLNKYPMVTVIDSGSNTVVGEVHYLSADRLQCVFSSAFSGKAILN